MAQLGDHRGVYGFVGISPGNRPYLREEAMTGTTAHRLVKVKAGQVWHQRDQDVYVGFTGSCWHDTPVPGSSDTGACPSTWHCCFETGITTTGLKQKACMRCHYQWPCLRKKQVPRQRVEDYPGIVIDINDPHD